LRHLNPSGSSAPRSWAERRCSRAASPQRCAVTSATAASCRLSALTELTTVGNWYCADAAAGRPMVASSTPATERRLVIDGLIVHPLDGTFGFSWHAAGITSQAAFRAGPPQGTFVP